ncbi:Transposon Tf2-9 poly [Paramuricea clavata]|uniref:Transposon Tf2-9 poly n=1 Tax=Paramuricea clavata TaxID=317549 RepID=A0A7D9JQA3_PARCT|nr:Transposon Tf2-9 poly [Paramuricea clavata]
MYLAGTLSRAALPDPVRTEVTGFEVFRIELSHQVNERNASLTKTNEGKLQVEIKRDHILSQFYGMIIKGWPDEKQKVTTTLIPESMQADMLSKIHVNRLGAEFNIRMAREVLFWPGSVLRKAIQNMCTTCGICVQYGQTLTKEPMKSIPLPSLPWEITSQELFTLEQRSYLVTVCHCSDWVEVDELMDTLSTTIINKTEVNFAMFGFPRVYHTDNGPQFIGKAYKEFAEEYDYNHTSYSPYHTQGNGRAEAAVKLVKNMIKKSDDFQAALLNYRNTSQRGHSYSPAQRMLCRHTRTKLPTSTKVLVPRMINRTTTQEELEH